jgi:hypothetical protein
MKTRDFRISFSFIINNRIRSVSIHYDKDYGIDKKRGWSLCINGGFVNQNV